MMFARGKFITGKIKDKHGPVLTAVCFCELVNHDSFKNSFVEILGAGFFWLDEDVKGNPIVVVQGKSVSLDVESRGEEDAFLIRRVLGLEPQY